MFFRGSPFASVTSVLALFSRKVGGKPFGDRQVSTSPCGRFDQFSVLVDVVESFNQHEVRSRSDGLKTGLKSQSALAGNRGTGRRAEGAIVARHDVAHPQSIPSYQRGEFGSRLEPVVQAVTGRRWIERHPALFADHQPIAAT